MDLAIKANTCFHPNLKSQEGQTNRQAELYKYTHVHNTWRLGQRNQY